ncbi:MAG: cytochrome c oxidase accessory protein CcoG [Bacteroidetes bacterium]|nr:cytochrome c oxidase accessory protein CcoG [Bacteroidota bacterium]
MEKKTPEHDESFRDSIATIGKDGKRVWIYAQKPKGKLYNLRTYASIFYLIVFFSLPFIKINGVPLFMFNILEGKFVLFTMIFWPHDFFLFGLGMMIFILFVALFTVVFGRVFCGWACPQTVFMEMVFRKVEYWIEGDASHQKSLNHGPWTREKIIKKTTKNIAFFIISFIIANTFLSYLIGVDKLFEIMNEPLQKHFGGFMSILIFTGVFYGVYVRFREQVCLVVCPYGRLQSVLLDKDSVVVAYDYVRGEQREKFHKNEVRKAGDCIDCHQCVKVCPTGIDIRNGTQLECVNCTACIDVCNHMMDSVGLPKDLIRYSSENGIAKNQKLRLTGRMIAYSIVLTVLIGIEVFLLASRSDVDATIIRARGMLYQEQPNNQISNLYNIELENKTYRDIPINLKLEDTKGEIKLIGKDLMVNAEAQSAGAFFIYLDKSTISHRKTDIKVGLYSNGKKIKTIKVSFLSPVSR